MQLLINNNARFCYQSKEKVYLQALLEEFKYEQKKTKIENLIDDEWQKSLSDSEADNDYNDKTESDGEYNE